MDNDVLSLLKILLTRSLIDLAELEIVTQSTRRQVTYRIEKINQYLSSNQQEEIKIGNFKEIVLPAKTRSFLIQKVFDENIHDYILNREERKIYLYLWMFLNKEYLSLQHFINQLQVSKSTLLADLNDLNNELKNDEVEINYDRTNGYSLIGDEMNIRKIMMRIIISINSQQIGFSVLNRIINDFHLSPFEYNQLVIQELTEQYQMSFVENRLVEFIYIFIFLVSRIVHGHVTTEKTNHLPLIKKMSTFKEYQFLSALIDFFKLDTTLNEYDKAYISSWILGVSFGDINQVSEDREIIMTLVERILSRFEVLSGVSFTNREYIFQQIYSHFRPAYYRLLFNLPIINPLAKKVKEEYAPLYMIVKETMKPLAELFGGEVSMDELAYLTIHFSTIYDTPQVPNQTRQKRATIICLNGIGSSIILYNELSSMFPDMFFELPIEVSQFDIKQMKPDIIFTTTLFKELLELDIPVIQVSPIMDSSEKQMVLKEVNAQLYVGQTLSFNKDKVYEILQRHHIEQEKIYSILSEMKSLFLQVNNLTNPSERQASLSLKEMMHKSLMRLQVECTDSQQALTLMGKVMIDEGIITQDYLDAVLELYDENPNYYVIAPKIALPHASPSKGALQAGIGLMTLKTPLCFGDSDLNPVSVILFLSGVDNYQHISAMGELLDLLNNPQFMDLLQHCDDPYLIYSFMDSVK